jgi:hypothetical protein
MWYIYTMEFYSAIMNEDFMSFAEKWMELVIILLTATSQSHKDKYCMFCKLGGSRRGTIMDTNGEKEMRGKKE